MRRFLVWIVGVLLGQFSVLSLQSHNTILLILGSVVAAFFIMAGVFYFEEAWQEFFK